MRLSVENFLDPFSRQRSVAIFASFFSMNIVDADRFIESYARKPDAVALVARISNDQTAGFVIAGSATVDDPWYTATGLDPPAGMPWMVCEVHVATAFRRMKIATSMMEQIEKYQPRSCPSLILGVDMRNLPARSLYERCGWRFTGKIFRPKGFNADQVLMEKPSFNPPATSPSPRQTP